MTVRIHPSDNVEISLENGQKYATEAIKEGAQVIKYGYPIGVAKCDIEAGEHVHSHNLRTGLSGQGSFVYRGGYSAPQVTEQGTFLGYRRRDGSVGVRNEVLILPMVGCVNGTARRLAEMTGAKAYTHPWGCSQLGGDLLTTQRVLAGLAKHPNAGGVLVLALGCENNRLEDFKGLLGEYDTERIRFLTTQESEDELAEGCEIIRELFDYANSFVREEIPISELVIGMKCGGSDGYSGITANPLVGRVAERLASFGACVILTEVPEMFGGEQVLLDRAIDRAVYDRATRMMQGFRDYFTSHGEGVSDNPSPGNVEGGITTLEEKSLGCVQKGGAVPVTDVLEIGERAHTPGLSLLTGPGNDIVAVTNLAASGAHIILFTTGRGTPLGGPVPTIKIATNEGIAERKRNWIDFDAGSVLTRGFDTETEALFAEVLAVAEGKSTKCEETGTQEISIFKDGIIL